jgi:hypothetical protein
MDASQTTFHRFLHIIRNTVGGGGGGGGGGGTNGTIIKHS